MAIVGIALGDAAAEGGCVPIAGGLQKPTGTGNDVGGLGWLTLGDRSFTPIAYTNSQGAEEGTARDRREPNLGPNSRRGLWALMEHSVVAGGLAEHREIIERIQAIGSQGAAG